MGYIFSVFFLTPGPSRDGGPPKTGEGSLAASISSPFPALGVGVREQLSECRSTYPLGYSQKKNPSPVLGEGQRRSAAAVRVISSCVVTNPNHLHRVYPAKRVRHLTGTDTVHLIAQLDGY